MRLLIVNMFFGAPIRLSLRLPQTLISSHDKVTQLKKIGVSKNSGTPK